MRTKRKRGGNQSGNWGGTELKIEAKKPKTQVETKWELEKTEQKLGNKS